MEWSVVELFFFLILPLLRLFFFLTFIVPSFFGRDHAIIWFTHTHSYIHAHAHTHIHTHTHTHIHTSQRGHTIIWFPLSKIEKPLLLCPSSKKRLSGGGCQLRTLSLSYLCFLLNCYFLNLENLSIMVSSLSFFHPLSLSLSDSFSSLFVCVSLPLSLFLFMFYILSLVLAQQKGYVVAWNMIFKRQQKVRLLDVPLLLLGAHK